MKNAQTEETKFQKIKKDFNESLSALSTYHADWREFDDFYLGKQWNTQRASWRPDPVVNYIAYVVDQKRPQLTNSRPNGIILPTKAGDEQIAKLFTQVTDVIADRVDLDSRIDEVVNTGLLLDVAWFKVYWDNSIEGGSPGMYWKGDIAIDAPDPANVYPDPQATTMEECRYVIYAVPKTVQWIKEKFGVQVEPDAVQSFQTEIYDRPGTNQSSDRVMLYEYWYREDGKLNCIYAAGGKILKEIKEIYKHGKYPFIPFVAKKRRKSIIGIGEPRNILSNQKLLNKLLEMPTTNALLTANPIALINRRSGIDKNQWVSKPGMVWEVEGELSNAVRWLQPPQFQGDVYKLIELLTTYIERIGGIYDALTGETPKGVTAASAIQLLQEQGSIPIKGIARNLYASIAEVYKQMIELIKEFYTETRYIRISGEDGGYEFIEFNAAQYAEVNFDVKVSAGPSTPLSRAFVSQLADELFDKQLLLPSEYVEMKEGVPNKERIVARLREQEGMQRQQQETMQPQPPSLNEIYAQAPPDLQREIDLMLEQGIPEDQIIQTLLQLLQR